MSDSNMKMSREQLERVVRQMIWQEFAGQLELSEGGGKDAAAKSGAYLPNLVVNISARHIHVTQEHLEKLFGPGAKLSVYRWLYQPGEFASEQTVTVLGPRRKAIENVRILGPVRSRTQVEISQTDSVALGIDAPVRASGSAEGSPGCVLIGPKGVVELGAGVIRAERHVHMSPADAEFFGFKDGQYVRLKIDSDCAMTFDRVRCRVSPTFLLEVHLDTDEGNACNLINAVGAELAAQ